MGMDALCVHMCACVWVGHNEKKVPDEWQARQAIPVVLQVSSIRHAANNNTTRARGPSCQSITAILTGEKEKQLRKPTLHHT